MRVLAVAVLAITLSVIRHLASHPGQRIGSSTCVMQALGRYFTGLSTPARGTICPSDRGPYDPDFGQPAASR